MWFILQGVFCWIGQYVDYVAEPDMKRAAGMLGGIGAFAVTYVIVRHNLGPNFGPKLPGTGRNKTALDALALLGSGRNT